MGYSSDKDVLVAAIGSVDFTDNSTLGVDLMCYNNGPVKAAITRVVGNFTKTLGRFSKEELDELIPLLESAKQALSE